MPAHDLRNAGGGHLSQGNDVIKRTLAEQLVRLTIKRGIEVVVVILGSARMMGKQPVLALAQNASGGRPLGYPLLDFIFQM